MVRCNARFFGVALVLVIFSATLCLSTADSATSTTVDVEATTEITGAPKRMDPKAKSTLSQLIGKLSTTRKDLRAEKKHLKRLLAMQNNETTTSEPKDDQELKELETRFKAESLGTEIDAVRARIKPLRKTERKLRKRVKRLRVKVAKMKKSKKRKGKTGKSKKKPKKTKKRKPRCKSDGNATDSNCTKIASTKKQKKKLKKTKKTSKKSGKKVGKRSKKKKIKQPKAGACTPTMDGGEQVCAAAKQQHVSGNAKKRKSKKRKCSEGSKKCKLKKAKKTKKTKKAKKAKKADKVEVDTAGETATATDTATPAEGKGDKTEL